MEKLRLLINNLFPHSTIEPIDRQSQAGTATMAQNGHSTSPQSVSTSKALQERGPLQGVPEHMMVVQAVEGAQPKKILLFVKTIIGEAAFYNLKISHSAFGPELIHEEDLKRLQIMMAEGSIPLCTYVLYSSDKDHFEYQFTFPLDRHYVEFITDT